VTGSGPISRALSALGNAGCNPRRSGDGYSARCPAHDDSAPSLSLSEGNDGRVLIMCQAGCHTEDVVARLGLGMADLFVPKDKADRSQIVATYDYTDAEGVVIYQVVRLVPKNFRQRRPDGREGWLWNLKGIARVPYRLPELNRVSPGGLVFVVEGEKDADRLARDGSVVATCNSGGAGKWPASWGETYFVDLSVVVIPDNDDAGRKHADAVVASVLPHAYEVRILNLAQLPERGDVSDWLNAGHGVNELLDLVDATAPLEHGSSSPLNARNRATAPPLLAYEQGLLTRFAIAARRCGLVGERTTAQLLYLAITSRMLDKPVSVGVKGHSSSGKSFVVETTCRFFPPSAVLEMTAMSERALVYSPESYKHRMLVLYEVVALREGVEDNQTAYFVRSLLSEGRIDYPVTVRDRETGGFTTKRIVKEGPTGLIFTTTKPRIHRENETRVISVTSDDSRAQTARVFRALAVDEAPADVTAWVELQQWIGECGERRVVIPYAVALAREVPPLAVRLRRDFGALLSLIRAHAILHQCNRARDEQGRIVAELGDYKVVSRLVAPLIAESVEATVSAVTRETVGAVAALVDEHRSGVRATTVATHLGLDKSNVSRRLHVAAEGGWLTNVEDKKGRPGRWVLGEPLPEDQRLLPTVARLREVVESRVRCTWSGGSKA
jgi:hypothetical protein